MLNERAVAVALVGLVRVSTSKQETARQHDALDGLCVKVFEEKVHIFSSQVTDRFVLTENLIYKLRSSSSCRISMV